MLADSEFCNFRQLLPCKTIKWWPPNKISHSKFVSNMIAGIDTAVHYVHFVRRILSSAAFCIVNEFSFNICVNSSFFPQLKHHNTKTNFNTPHPSDKIKITIRTNTMRSFIAVILSKAEQTSVVAKADFQPKCLPKMRTLKWHYLTKEEDKYLHGPTRGTRTI